MSARRRPADMFTTGVIYGILSHPDHSELVGRFVADMAKVTGPAPVRAEAADRLLRLALLRLGGFDLVEELEDSMGLEMVEWLHVADELWQLNALRNRAESPIDGSPLSR
jgi:hypothetical protein